MKIESKNGIDDVMTTVIVYWMILAVLAAWRSGFSFLHRNWTQYVNRGKDSGGFNSMEVNVSCKVWERHIGFHEANEAKQVGSKNNLEARRSMYEMEEQI